MIDFQHQPVLAIETLELLNVKPDGIYIDGTAGGGGHSSLIAQKLSGGRLLSLDRDPDAVSAASKRLSTFPQASVVLANYSDIAAAAHANGITEADGILLDLGVSSFQLDCAERGFSYNADAPLDMRMSQTGMSAVDVVNTYSFEQLARLLRVYGEEKYSGSIASAIVKARELAPIETTAQLAELVRNNVPQSYRRDKNPCKKTFQAIRIEVNDEFGHLEKGIEGAFSLLKIGGRIAVITFHSLEDRIVKQAFAELCRGCICPPQFPQCICGKTPRAAHITRKPVVAADTELSENNRSHSAKLRVLERIG